MKLKFKLSILIISIMTFIITGISIVELREARRISLNLSLRSLEYKAEQEAVYWKGREDGYIRVMRSLANVMAGYEGVDDYRRRDFFDSVLENTLKAESNMAQIFTVWNPNAIDRMDAHFTDRGGSTVTGQYARLFSRESSRIEAGTAAPQQVTAAIAHINSPFSQRDYVGNPAANYTGGRQTHTFTMMVPIVNPYSNETVGIVGCVVMIDAIQSLLEQTMGEHEEIAIMIMYSGNGTVLAHYIPERIGRNMLDVDFEHGDNLQAAFRAVQNGESFFGKVFDPNLDTYIEYFMEPFQIGNSENHWSVLIGTTDEYIFKEVKALIRFTIILVLISVLLTALIIYYALNQVTKPIVKLADTLKDISEGEGDLTRTINVKSNDELGTMALYFNRTLEKIKKMVITIKGETVILSDIGTDLASNMTETAASINEITSNIQSIKSRMLNQSASVTQTNASMEQITVNIDKLNSHVERQTASVAKSSTAIEEMLANIRSVTKTLVNNAENVNGLTEAAELGRTSLSDVVEDVQKIAMESEGLLEINSVMENIASQTNLLSMNAAIEAAHAGDAGKGFAVVANEIRKLAESSREQSKTISTVLKKIKVSIDSITASTNNVLQKFEAINSNVKIVAEQEENIRCAMEEQGEGSKQILESIGEVKDITGLVKGVSLEMFEGSKEVIREAMNLSNTTTEISGGMNEMAAGADQINAAVNAVNELSRKNRENINDLAKEVSRFKVE